MLIDESKTLLEIEVPANPLTLFSMWFRTAEISAGPEPSAMTLATADANGRPSARMVLLRGFDDRGFAFYTNYQGRKAEDLAQNPRAALVLFWEPLARQIRIEGTVEKVSAEESDAYFHSRPVGHQLGAWVSAQSQLIASRGVLEESLEKLQSQYPPGTEVPRPPYWGGYRVVPNMIEFWQGRENRLHDRLRYRRAGSAWIIERLAP